MILFNYEIWNRVAYKRVVRFKIWLKYLVQWLMLWMMFVEGESSILI